MTEKTVTSGKMTNKRRRNKSPSGSPIEKWRKDSVICSQRASLSDFKNESSISINDVMESSPERIAAQLQDHSYTSKRGLQGPDNLNTYGDSLHAPSRNVSIELPGSDYDELELLREEIRHMNELSKSDFELPDSDYEELENQQLKGKDESKVCSSLSDFELPDSDYDEFENPKAEIEGNKDTEKIYFKPMDYEEEDVEENDFHNLQFTSTQVIPEVMPMVAQVVNVQEADSSIADEADDDSFTDFEVASSDYEPDENYQEYLRNLILKNKNKVYC